MARKRNEEEVSVVTLDDAADIDAIAAALEGEDLSNVQVPLDEINEQEVEEAIEIQEARDNAYSEQEPKIEVADEATIAEAAKSSKAVKQKRIAVVSGDAAEQFESRLVELMGDNVILDMDEGELTADQVKAIAATIKQVKVREKALNLMQAITGSARLSNYTEAALNVINEAVLAGKSEVSINDIKTALTTKGYKSGTVASQSGQMMALFPSLKIASVKSRGVLEINENSVLLDAFQSA